MLTLYTVIGLDSAGDARGFGTFARDDGHAEQKALIEAFECFFVRFTVWRGDASPSPCAADAVRVSSFVRAGKYRFDRQP